MTKFMISGGFQNIKRAWENSPEPTSSYVSTILDTTLALISFAGLGKLHMGDIYEPQFPHL